VLAKAVKEQERRKGEKEGFSAAPGDCLAYKHYRDVRPRPRARAEALGTALVSGACWGALSRAALACHRCRSGQWRSRRLRMDSRAAPEGWYLVMAAHAVAARGKQ